MDIWESGGISREQHSRLTGWHPGTGRSFGVGPRAAAAGRLSTGTIQMSIVAQHRAVRDPMAGLSIQSAPRPALILGCILVKLSS